MASSRLKSPPLADGLDVSLIANSVRCVARAIGWLAT